MGNVQLSTVASANRLWNTLGDGTRSITTLRNFKKYISNKYVASNSKLEHGDPHFLLSNCNQHDKTQPFAKFKKILRRGFRATLNFRKFKSWNVLETALSHLN